MQNSENENSIAKMQKPREGIRKEHLQYALATEAEMQEERRERIRHEEERKERIEKRREALRKKRFRMRCVIVALSGLLLILLAFLFIPKREDPALFGRWVFFSETPTEVEPAYTFSEDGKGNFTFQEIFVFDFNYEIHGDTLKINFVDESLDDEKFAYKIENQQLVLESLIDSNKGEISVFEKTEEAQ